MKSTLHNQWIYHNSFIFIEAEVETFIYKILKIERSTVSNLFYFSKQINNQMTRNGFYHVSAIVTRDKTRIAIKIKKDDPVQVVISKILYLMNNSCKKIFSIVDGTEQDFII